MYNCCVRFIRITAYAGASLHFKAEMVPMPTREVNFSCPIHKSTFSQGTFSLNGHVQDTFLRQRFAMNNLLIII
jgi:hypothetical protein